MHHAMSLIAERQGVHAPIGLFVESYVPYVQGLMQNYYGTGVSLEATSLFLRGESKTVYILLSLEPTLVLLLVRFTEYDDDTKDKKYIYMLLNIDKNTTLTNNNLYLLRC
ncbi:hypothetical protein Hanom_Chr02g00112801 [Helianthus anomalus]